MKAILISIRPEWVAKILNGEKTIEIRKKFPKDYVGWMYIYVTKDKNQLIKCQEKVWGYYKLTKGALGSYFNGKVVARFWCNKVGNFSKEIFGTYEEPFTYNQDDLLKKSCLTEKELDIYLQGKNGKAIHITKLEIFDKPKEIKEFYKVGYREEFHNLLECEEKYSGVFCEKDYKQLDLKYQLTRAPQSWCFVEI